jgi:hypothetical protein
MVHIFTSRHVWRLATEAAHPALLLGQRLVRCDVDDDLAESNTNSTFTSPNISQEGQEVQSNNDGTNGSVIRSHGENLLKDSMTENPKDMTTNATTKDMKDTTTNGHTTTSTTESVETVGVQSSVLEVASKETTKE